MNRWQNSFIPHAGFAGGRIFVSQNMRNFLLTKIKKSVKAQHSSLAVLWKITKHTTPSAVVLHFTNSYLWRDTTVVLEKQLKSVSGIGVSCLDANLCKASQRSSQGNRRVGLCLFFIQISTILLSATCQLQGDTLVETSCLWSEVFRLDWWETGFLDSNFFLYMCVSQTHAFKLHTTRCIFFNKFWLLHLVLW